MFIVNIANFSMLFIVTNCSILVSLVYISWLVWVFKWWTYFIFRKYFFYFLIESTYHPSIFNNRCLSVLQIINHPKIKHNYIIYYYTTHPSVWNNNMLKYIWTIQNLIMNLITFTHLLLLKLMNIKTSILLRLFFISILSKFNWVRRYLTTIITYKCF